MIVGILGSAGSIGSRHARNLMTLGHQVIGYDPFYEGKGPSREEALNTDAIIICTPTKQHFADMLDANPNIPLLVEKPIAYDAGGPLVRGFCYGHNGLIAVANNLRFHDCVRKAKVLVENGAIGTVHDANFRVDQKTTRPTYLMDGVSRNWGAHEIDLALYLLGEGDLLEVNNSTIIDGNDVQVEFALQHGSADNGVDTVSRFHMDYLTEPEKRGFELIGTGGTIKVDLVGRTLDLNGEIYRADDSWDQNYISEMKAFIQSAETGILIPPLASGLDGADALEIILAIREQIGLDA